MFDSYSDIDTQANDGNSGETEDLGRFNLDFNFPSPVPVANDDLDQDQAMNDDDGFELPAVDLPGDTGFPSDSDDGNEPIGDLGMDANMDNLGANPSPRWSPAPMSESPGIVGGGLREEDTIIQGSKQKKLSRHGIPVPNMPAGVVKKLATRFAPARAGSKTKVSKATLAAIEQASSWYFEQMSEDLAAYSKHAGRKTIDESDVAALIRR